MTEPAVQRRADVQWSDRVLRRLNFFPKSRWGLWRRSKIGFAILVVIVVALAIVRPDWPEWWRIALPITLGSVAVLNLTAFLVKIVREFLAGYRDGS